MFMNRVGAQFQCEGVTYTIGGKVCANDASDYEGLYGTITEIRDGDDRETENDTPDIYCSFMPPVLADDIKAIESRFSQLYRREMHLEDIGLDTVIMAPDMLKVLEPIPSWQKLTIYIIREDWAFGGNYGEDFSLTTTPETSCQGLFNQIHKKATKKVPGSTFMLLTLRQAGHLRPLNSSSQRYAYSGNWSI